MELAIADVQTEAFHKGGSHIKVATRIAETGRRGPTHLRPDGRGGLTDLAWPVGMSGFTVC